MSTKLFVNLPVKDLNHSIEFFTRLGFRFNPQFTDEKATCMIIGEDNFAMLLTRDFFKTFTKKEVIDAKKSTETLLCLSADSREKVNEIVDKAVKAGGTEPHAAVDQGFMYYRTFEDPDGHIWEIMWMDPAAVGSGQ